MGEGGIEPGYFLDRMTIDEVKYFLKGLSMRNRDTWEQTRILGYIIAQSNSTKTLKQTDILKFPWDIEEKKEKTTPISDEELERLRAKAKRIETQLKE